MVIKDLNTIFIHIPKCGGKSIARNLQPKGKRIKISNNWHPYIVWHEVNNNIETVPHFTYDQAVLQFPDYRYITQIRNPLSRWESIFKHFSDRGFIKTKDFEEWSKRAIQSLTEVTLTNIMDDIKLYEGKASFWHIGVILKPQWTFFRQPEVEVHKLEEGTIWESLGIEPIHIHRSKTTIRPYNEENIKDIIYNYYKRDFEYYGG